jgi:tetratricopeptide (TPR) repeat protein
MGYIGNHFNITFSGWKVIGRFLVGMSLWLGIGLTLLHADEFAAAFDQANKLYAQGQYAEAAAAYQKLVDSRRVSAALYFNLGNAYFKNNQLGYAIAHYRLARNLAPRDPEVRANLQYARSRAGASSSTPPDNPRAWLSWLALDEWTLLAMVTGWLWIGLLTLGLWRDEWQSKLGKYTRLTGAIWVIIMLCFGFKVQAALNAKPAVVVVRDATVRYGPLEEAREAFTLPDGAEVVVLDEQGNWVQIRDASRRTGWLRRNQLLVLTPGS